MRIFNNDKNKEEFSGLVVKTSNNTNEIVAVRRDIDINKTEQDELNKFLLDKICMLEKIILVNKEELKELQIESEKVDNLSLKDICKDLKLKNINSSGLKFYLYENGLLTMSINKDRNSFSLNTNNIDNVDKILMNSINIINDQLSFDNSFITYAETNQTKIEESLERYSNKQKQYKISKKNLESRNVKNYQREIGKICGVKDNFDKEKWTGIYKKYGEKYTSFFNDYNKYKKENDISVVAYVVTIMGEGNYLLKIACDLYA